MPTILEIAQWFVLVVLVTEGLALRRKLKRNKIK